MAECVAPPVHREATPLFARLTALPNAMARFFDGNAEVDVASKEAGGLYDDFSFAADSTSLAWSKMRLVSEDQCRAAFDRTDEFESGELTVEQTKAVLLELLGDVQPVVPVTAIAEWHRAHLPMAIATGSPKWVAEKILKALGIREWFDAVVGAECVAHSKPAPDVYLRAAELIGVDPRRCHAFEDTALGMQAAENAGMTVVNIHTLL